MDIHSFSLVSVLPRIDLDGIFNCFLVISNSKPSQKYIIEGIFFLTALK